MNNYPKFSIKGNKVKRHAKYLVINGKAYPGQSDDKWQALFKLAGINYKKG